MLAVAISAAPASATETGSVSDEPLPVPSSEAAPELGATEEGVTSSTMRMSPNLTIVRAQIRRGRLTISAVVASGAIGKLRGRAHFGGRTHRFTARIDSRGVIRIDERLRGARRASSARVSLAFEGTTRFLSQRLTLRVTRQSTEMRVLRISY